MTTTIRTKRTAKGHGIARGQTFWWMGLGRTPQSEAQIATIVGYDRGFYTVFIPGRAKFQFHTARKFWVLKDRPTIGSAS